MEDAQVKMGRPILYNDEKHRRMREWSRRKRESLRLGIPMQKPASKKVQLVCAQCGDVFHEWPGNLKSHPTRGKYCSRKCVNEAHAANMVSMVCGYCGKEFEVMECKIRNARGKYCSRQCGRAAQGHAVSGANNLNWNGGSWMSRGYRVLSVGHGKQEREHRHLMETLLGRKLDENEVVHHKNGNKADNSPDNLEVMTRADHMRLHNPRGWQKEDAS